MNGPISNWKQDFFTIQARQALSQFSSFAPQFVVMWYLTDQTGSTLVLSATMMMGFLSQGVLGPFVGVFIGQHNWKRIMIVSDLLISVVSFVAVIAGWMDVLSAEPILAVLLCRSAGSAFHTPCLQVVTPQIIPEDQLTRYVGYSQALESVSQMSSPVLATVFYSLWSLSGIIFLDVIGALTAVFVLGITSISELSRDGSRGKVQALWGVKKGFQILLTNKGMLGLALIDTLYTLAPMPTSALFPPMSMSYFNGTGTRTSLVEVVFSLGFSFGSLILSRWGGTKNRTYTTIGSFLLISLSLFISRVLPPGGFLLFVVCSWLVGVSGPSCWGIYTPLLQNDFEARHLGHVLLLSSSIQLISDPVGLTVSGVSAETYGVEGWFLIAGTLVLLASFLCLTVSAVRSCGTRGTTFSG